MKKNKTISFRLVSYTDAAGKYSPDAVRGGNEDNFYVDDDLSDSTTNSAAQDEVMQLGAHGMLMVVADGMGGMNAGEVASQIAVDTVRAAFTADKITDTIVESASTRQKYMEQVIRKADKNIKSEARSDRSREGMGSTIIMAWLFGNELSVSWCGDSRAYIFNEKSGIRLISQDHSYVQELVNKGMLTYDQTFDHPQNNIITRSLGDPSQDAKGESKTIEVGKGDIILLCSDGLSGVLRDRKTYDSNGQPFPEENLEDIIRAHTASMKECREALWVAAERGGWYDNVTAILCQIIDGPESRWGSQPAQSFKFVKAPASSVSRNKILLFSLIGLLVVGAIVGAFFLGRGSSESSDVASEVKNDTMQEPVQDSLIIPETENSATTLLPEEGATTSIATEIEKRSERESELNKNEREPLSEPDSKKSEGDKSELNKIEKNLEDKFEDKAPANEEDKLKEKPKNKIKEKAKKDIQEITDKTSKKKRNKEINKSKK